MPITLTDQTRLLDLQKEFNVAYPFLWIEFLGSQLPLADPLKKKVITGNQPLSEFSGADKGELILTPAMKVSDLVQKFRTSYNITVQVFRKSGKAWLEITGTDSWSLAEQNSEGAALSIFKN